MEEDVKKLLPWSALSSCEDPWQERGMRGGKKSFCMPYLLVAADAYFYLFYSFTNMALRRRITLLSCGV